MSQDSSGMLRMVRSGTLCLWCTKRDAYLSTQGVERSKLESHYQTEQRRPKNEDKSELPIHAPTRCIPRHGGFKTRWYRSWECSNVLRVRQGRSCRQGDPGSLSHVRNRVRRFTRKSRLRVARTSGRNIVHVRRVSQRRCSVSWIWFRCLGISNRKISGVDCERRFFAGELQIAMSRFVRSLYVAEKETLCVLSVAIGDF